MKILWVCNIMLPVIAGSLGFQASNKEGWLSGLADMILKEQENNHIELGVAFPVTREYDGYREELVLKEGSHLMCYGFYEDVANAERYEETLEVRMRQIMQDFGPDVVHCFGTEYGHTLAAAKVCGDPAKVLIGIQGICSEYAKAYMADLPKKVQKSITFRDWLKKDTLMMQQKKFTLRGERETLAVQRAGNITGRTGWDRSYAKQVNPKATYYAMNETLRPIFYTGQWNYDTCEKGRIFLSQGDYPVKGLHYMLIALGRIRQRYPQARICVAGNSLVENKTLRDRIKRSAYGSYLRHLIHQYHLEGHVEFAGRLNAEEMKAQYLKAELFVCCSSLENSPNSLGEAMLLGVPCVTADVGGIPTLFEHEADGLLFRGFRLGAATSPEKVAENLSQAILSMWEDPKKAKAYGNRARAHALKTHNKEANYARLLEIYAEIAGK